MIDCNCTIVTILIRRAPQWRKYKAINTALSTCINWCCKMTHKMLAVVFYYTKTSKHQRRHIMQLLNEKRKKTVLRPRWSQNCCLLRDSPNIGSLSAGQMISPAYVGLYVQMRQLISTPSPNPQPNLSPSPNTILTNTFPSFQSTQPLNLTLVLTLTVVLTLTLILT